MDDQTSQDRLGALLLERTRHPSPLGDDIHARISLKVRPSVGGDAERRGDGWTVHVDGEDLSLQAGARSDVDTTVVTDVDTLLALVTGRRSGVEAFLAGDLLVRGNLELSLRLAGLYAGSDTPARFPLPRDTDVEERSTFYLEAGRGPPVLLLHGLGATNASMLPILWELAEDHHVFAPDLPGFGGSDKPWIQPLHAAYFAGWVRSFLDAVGVDRADVVGNSMGGRVAIDVGLRSPQRVGHLVLLAPSPAWLRGRDLLWLVRILRPEMALLPVPLIPRRRVVESIERMFADPSRLPDGWIDAAADEFLRVYGTPRGRRAFYSAARQIYLEDPYEGRGRFWGRLPSLRPPALFVWGGRDRLVPSAFARHVHEALPGAESVVLDDCGHVPQFELPQRTNKLIRSFIETASDHASRTAP